MLRRLPDSHNGSAQIEHLPSGQYFPGVEALRPAFRYGAQAEP
jgi:hypothetical protein